MHTTLMKTTLNLEEGLIKQVKKIYNVRTKTEAINLALKNAIATEKRKQIANLYGKLPQVEKIARR